MPPADHTERDPRDAILDRSRFVLELDDDFDTPELRADVWLPVYLPQWSSRDAAAARYTISDGCLRLRIDADQRPWAPDIDGATRVSSIQTGVSSGPVGSTIGQHRFRDRLVVREEQPRRLLYAPNQGLIEARLRTTDDPAAMAALWLIGIEDEPSQSAEICIAEIFGRDVRAGETRVGMGLHPFGDPSIRDDFGQEPVPIDAREFHVYSAAWDDDGVAFYVDDRLIRVSSQSPGYPLQAMLGIYDLGDGGDAPSPRDAWPKELIVDWFRVWRRAG